MNRTTFHVLGLAHQPVCSRVASCAFTMKVYNMCQMIKTAGHEVVLYGAGDTTTASEIDTHYVSCVSTDLLRKHIGNNFYETHNLNASSTPLWESFQKNVRRFLPRNLSKNGRDIVLASYGTDHEPGCPDDIIAPTIEMGIGYEWCFAKRKVWESSVWRHFIMGKRSLLNNDNVNFEHDTVIPGFVDPAMFSGLLSCEGYFLYLGRVIPCKGVEWAYKAAEAHGRTLVIAGGGDIEWIKNTMPKAEYVGMVDHTRRSSLLAQAAALLCPTQYLEPFGMVSVEAATAGVPVIATNWGAFVENVSDGYSGYRVSNIRQMIEKTSDESISKIKASNCQEWSKQFWMENIWPRYEAYFDQQYQIWEETF